MKYWMMALEYRGNSRQGAIALTQRRDLWNGKMFPGNQSERQGRNRAKDLRDKDDVFSTDAIGQMSGGLCAFDFDKDEDLAADAAYIEGQAALSADA